jgi:DUF3006 family protein
MQYVIDKIEDGWAELEDENGKVFGVPAHWLPSGAREGDVLKLATEESSSDERTLRFTLDPAGRQEQQTKARDLRDKLPRGPKGDISL